MSDLSMREAAARASFETTNPGQTWATLVVLAQRPYSPERATWRTHFAIAGAALAAVADHPGLAEVLVQHPSIPTEGRNPYEFHCPTCRNLLSGGPNSPAHAAHLADVVRAWLLGAA